VRVKCVAQEHNTVSPARAPAYVFYFLRLTILPFSLLALNSINKELNKTKLVQWHPCLEQGLGNKQQLCSAVVKITRCHF